MPEMTQIYGGSKAPLNIDTIDSSCTYAVRCIAESGLSGITPLSIIGGGNSFTIFGFSNYLPESDNMQYGVQIGFGFGGSNIAIRSANYVREGAAWGPWRRISPVDSNSNITDGCIRYISCADNITSNFILRHAPSEMTNSRYSCTLLINAQDRSFIGFYCITVNNYGETIYKLTDNSKDATITRILDEDDQPTDEVFVSIPSASQLYSRAQLTGPARYIMP